MLDPQYGLVTYLLRLVGLPSVNWLGDPRVALWTLVLVTVWKTIGYPMVIYLAGLQAIPTDFHEAAALDGASGWNRFRFITWPLLTPTTLFLLVTLTIASFQGFDIVKIMTQGGPVTSTVIYVYYIYEQAFQYFKLGKASAAVVIFFTLILLLTLVQWALFRRRVQYTV
jgi:sn-glycerol 3-phosphate transport system permease protein